MRTGITNLPDALVSASVILTAAIICAGAARADPSQQQDQFVALLEQDQIPVIDNLPALVARAHQICDELEWRRLGLYRGRRRDERYIRGKSGLPPRIREGS